MTHLMNAGKRSCLQGFLVLHVILFSASVCFAQGGGGTWLTGGQNLENTRYQKTESKISADNVGQLVKAWSFTTGGDVSATPAVDGDHVYFPDFAGNLFKLDRRTGAQVWARKISDFTGVAGDFARVTPAVSGDLLIFGDQGGRLFAGANVMAVNKNTGNLVWCVPADEHPAAIVTQSAAVFGNVVYVGVASFEELFAAVIPDYELTFRGSMMALDRTTGELLWRTYTCPVGFTGCAVWGSTPSIDLNRGQLYIATGNNYSAPQEFLDCVLAAGDDEDAQRDCLSEYPDNYFDSVLALDMVTGEVKWANTVIPFDVWTVACLFGLCEDPEGPDFDFGQAPMIYRVGKTDCVGVGQKSGIFWSLSADTGEVLWQTRVGPGGVAGGMIWGSACDGTRIYTSEANSESKPWTLPNGAETTAGIWSALDPRTGEILWQTSNPTGYKAGGAATVANGVVYVGSQDPDGHMYGLNAATGEIEWDFVSGGSCNAGAAVVQGTVYWGSGYAGFGPPNTGNNKFYAFQLPKKLPKKK